MMKRKGIWIGLLIGVLVCAVAGGVLWWRQQHPQPYCSVIQDDIAEYKMCTDKRGYQFSEPIHITFTIKNISADTGQQSFGLLEFGNNTEPAMDICDPWGYACWSDGRTLTVDDKHFVLGLGESRTLTWTWPTTSDHLSYIKERMDTNYNVRCLSMVLRDCETWASRGRLECNSSGHRIAYGECSGWGR